MRFSRSLQLIAFLAAAALPVSCCYVRPGNHGRSARHGEGCQRRRLVAPRVVRGTAMAGEKLDSESTGYYRFANLPPGAYSIQVSAKGFKTEKREGMDLETGHLPTADIAMEVGLLSEVVEVSGRAPVIDVTTNTNQTNITSEVIDNAPHGYSFQSVIQFAPMARNEPLAGGIGGKSGTRAVRCRAAAATVHRRFLGRRRFGFREQYLVEGQDTENISGGIPTPTSPSSSFRKSK